jgi:pimeloyl-ACP methyl ester carboxylesterase
MTAFVAIPALGCDHRLYDKIWSRLEHAVDVKVIISHADDLSSCVSQVLEQAPARFVVLGTSFGGRVALELALAAPGRVTGLVVIGAGPGPAVNPDAGRRRSQRLRGGEFEQVVAEMAAMISHLPGPNGPAAREAFIAMARDQGPDLMARQSDALAKRADLWPRMAEIGCPALMLWGAQDQFSPTADGLRLSSSVAHGRYVELADCGHFPPLEYPEESAAALSHWLSDNRLT